MVCHHHSSHDILQWDDETSQENVCTSDPGQGLQLFPASIQLSDPSWSSLPAVQSVWMSDSFTTRTGWKHTTGSSGIFNGVLLELKGFCLLQIRVPLKDWEDIKRFEKDAVDSQHLDVVYILRQLMAQKAFYFTAMPTLVTLLVQQENLPQCCIYTHQCSLDNNQPKINTIPKQTRMMSVRVRSCLPQAL